MRRGVVVAVFLVALAAALPGVAARATYGAQTSADEPWYLLTALSLATDGDLDLSDELAAAAYLPFHEIAVDEQTTVLDGDGRRVAPHDPLLPTLLAPTMLLPEDVAWRASKGLLAVVGALLAGLTAWVAMARLRVRPWVAGLVVGGLGAALPSSAYATQVYPEAAAALAVMVVVAAATSPRLAPAPSARWPVHGRHVAAPGAARAGPARAGARAFGDARAGATSAAPTSTSGTGRVGADDPGVRHEDVGARAPTGEGPSGGDGSAGAHRRGVLASIAGVVLGLVALPWLSVKYVPVAATLAVVVGWRAWRAGRRGLVLGAAGVLALAGLAYLVAHLRWYGGWTVYAAGDHFVETGELSVVGTSPDLLGRSRRLVGLLVDRDYGLGAWTPAWLLAPAAVTGAWRRLGAARGLVLAPLAAGWLTATFVALTMHGWWVPGRQVVVVLPLVALALCAWVDGWRSGAALRGLGLLLVAGVANALWALREAATGGPVLIVDLADSAAPIRRLLAPLLPDGRVAGVADDVGLLAWAAILALSAAAAFHHATPDRGHVGVHQRADAHEPRSAGDRGRPAGAVGAEVTP